jgi:acetylornithine deacetylase
MNAAEILKELVAIPTASALSNLPLLSWVARFLETRDWQIELYPYRDGNGVEKANLIARPVGADPNVPIDPAFVCHTDTVPHAADWQDALRLTSKDKGFLHGCGACDVKGALACFLAAVDASAPRSVNPRVALILTADEEIGCKGIERLLGTTNLRIGSAIVSEPTSLYPGVAGKGYGLARVTIRGIEAHSAFPGEGLSAIALAADFICRIENLGSASESNPDQKPVVDALFEPPHTTINIGTIQGGTAKNIVAGSCTFLVEWRPVPGDAPRRVFEAIEQEARNLLYEQPRAHIEVQLLRAEPGFGPSNSGPLLNRLAEVAHSHQSQSRPVTGISFGSEASRLARIAEEVIVIGPGDMHSAHSDRECVPIAELEEWTETLRALLMGT